MRSILYIVLSACAALAAAQNANPFNNPPGGYNFKAGAPTNLSWKPTSQGTVTLKLQSGGQINPSTGITIASHIPNSGSFTWTPPASLEDKNDYTIEIINDANQEYNFLPRFSIAGVTGGASTVASTTAPTTTTAGQTTTATMMTTTSAPTTTSTGTSMTTTTSSSSSKVSSSSAVSSKTSTAATTKTTGATTTTGASASASSSAAATTVPNTNGGVTNNVSGGLMALALAAIAAF